MRTAVNLAALAGKRYVESEAYRAAREAGYFKSGHPFPDAIQGVPVLDGAEMLAALNLRAYSNMTAFEIDGVPYVGELPGAANVHGAVETIPVESVQVELASESAETELGTSVQTGTPFPMGDLEFGASPTLQEVFPFGILQPVTVGMLDDPGRVQSIIGRRIEFGIGIGLDNDILIGNNNWTGAVASVPAANIIAKTGYRAAAIRTAAAQVQDGGWYVRPLQVVINPITLGTLFEEEDGSQRPLNVMEMFDGVVDSWIVSNKMTPGKALVGDLFEAIGLFVKGPIEIAISRENEDFFSRSMVLMQIGFRAFSWVRQAGALGLATGLA